MLPPSPALVASRNHALEVLLGDRLSPVVDMVGWCPATDHYMVASAEGSIEFRRTAGRPGPRYQIVEVRGTDPLGNQDPTMYSSLEAEFLCAHPTRSENSYPFAFDQFAQLFDHPSAPDLCAIHSADHNWEDQGGHPGEHGSLGVIQARAPFIAAGAGVRRLGLVDKACRLVDVAPTILALLVPSAAGGPRSQPGLARQDGAALSDLLVGQGVRAGHVVGILLDGTNANVLYDLARRGSAPNVSRLMASGVVYRYGAVASLPTVTLPNHTSILTGAHPGHHGILHNAWVDRSSGRQVVTNSPSTWPSAMGWLNPGVETVHVALKQLLPGATTAAINEPCDVGADFSTFDLVRRGESLDRPPAPDDLPDATERFVRPSKDYGWASRVDHTAVDQFCGIWSSTYRGTPWPVPTFTWVNFTLTDAAFHAGGPYSEMAASAVMDTDARLGRVFDAVERSGHWDETAFLLMADHGMQQTDPSVRGDWGEELRAAGVPFRDEGYGFLYL